MLTDGNEETGCLITLLLLLRTDSKVWWRAGTKIPDLIQDNLTRSDVCFIAGLLDMTDCWWAGRGRPPTCYSLTSSPTRWTSLWRSLRPYRQSSMNRPSPSSLSRWVSGVDWTCERVISASEQVRTGRREEGEGECERGKLITPICYQNYQQVVGLGLGR